MSGISAYFDIRTNPKQNQILVQKLGSAGFFENKLNMAELLQDSITEIAIVFDNKGEFGIIKYGNNDLAFANDSGLAFMTLQDKMYLISKKPLNIEQKEQADVKKQKKSKLGSNALLAINNELIFAKFSQNSNGLKLIFHEPSTAQPYKAIMDEIIFASFTLSKLIKDDLARVFSVYKAKNLLFGEQEIAYLFQQLADAGASVHLRQNNNKIEFLVSVNSNNNSMYELLKSASIASVAQKNAKTKSMQWEDGSFYNELVADLDNVNLIEFKTDTWLVLGFETSKETNYVAKNDNSIRWSNSKDFIVSDTAINQRNAIITIDPSKLNFISENYVWLRYLGQTHLFSKNNTLIIEAVYK